MKTFKYQSEISKYVFDFSDFTEKDVLSFRWVFSDINDVRNFLPRYLISPGTTRLDPKGWGLSFYVSESQAKEKYIQIINNKRNLYKKLGTHLSNGTLKKDDGISDNPNDFGHFTFFEYEGKALKNKFIIIAKLINE